jgi:hypothetical protein
MKNMQKALRQLLNRWLPRGFARSVSILVSGSALAQVIATAASPILTRIYKPTDRVQQPGEIDQAIANVLRWRLYMKICQFSASNPNSAPNMARVTRFM